MIHRPGFPVVGKVRLYRGDGTGEFRFFAETDLEAFAAKLIDLDHDGHLDVVAASDVGGAIAYGAGDGTFPVKVVLSPLGREPVFGDFDGDGHLDLHAHGKTFQARGRGFVTVVSGVDGSAAGDLDGDGRHDLVTTAGEVYLSNGDGTFRSAGAFGPNGLVLLDDRDGDGRLDLVVLRKNDEDGYENQASVLLNRTTPNHPPVTTAATGKLASAWPPNHRLTPVGITGITDADGDAVTLTITSITQDEPVGPNGPDAIFTGDAAQVRIERDGAGNGRVYTIHFAAADGCGGVTAGVVSVCVPHDQGHGACGDDGQRFNSLSRSWLASEEAGPTATERPFSARVLGERVALRYSADAATPVRLEVFDVAGRKLATVDEGPRAAGLHEASWNAAGVPRGIYFARLRLGVVTRSTTILLR